MTVIDHVVLRRSERRKVRRLLRRRRGRTGIIFVGRFALQWAFARPSNNPVVSLTINGKSVAGLNVLKRGPVWIDLSPHRRQLLTIFGVHGDGSKTTLERRLREGERLLVSVQPARQVFRRSVSPLIEVRTLGSTEDCDTPVEPE